MGYRCLLCSSLLLWNVKCIKTWNAKYKSKKWQPNDKLTRSTWIYIIYLFIYLFIKFTKMCENTIKGIKGVKVKILFQGLHMTRIIFMLIYNLNFTFWKSSLTLHVKYKYVWNTIWFYIIYIMHSSPLSHKYEQLLLQLHFQNP
jgi:hypothetical protein